MTVGPPDAAPAVRATGAPVLAQRSTGRDPGQDAAGRAVSRSTGCIAHTVR